MSTVQTHDLMPVHSRVSWGAVFAGTVVALAVYFLFSVLGVALGLSVTPHVQDRALGIGAAIWALASVLLSLFLGGWVTSQCTVGENPREALVYGVLTWGTLFAVLLWFMGMGVRVGFSAVMGAASTPAVTQAVNQMNDADLRAAGFSDEQITNFRNQFDQLRARSQNVPAELRSAAEDPRAVQAAWWTFGGVLLSMLAAIGGAVAGSGPNFVLTGIGLRSVVMGMDYSNRPTTTASR